MFPLAFQRVTYSHLGNQLGYATLLDRVQAGLGRHVTWDDFAPVVLHICAPMVFVPIRGRVNVLFSMFESPDMPAEAIERIKLADVIIVPSTFCAKIFRRYTAAPIHVAALGADPQPVADRQFDVPFRWLWCGALNLRKGWQVLAHTWDRHFNTPAYRGKLELYLKTTAEPGQPAALDRQGPLVFDSRKLPKDELEALYASAHAFAYPTLGEGFGLTLAEAMASGLPCVATNYGGHLDFATPRVCKLVPATVRRLEPDASHRSAADDGKYAFATMRVDDLAAAMLAIMQDYDGALAMGQRAAKAMRAFTWDACCARVAGILEREHRRVMRKAA